jgi:Domain of unknown function (DUF4405)
MNIPCKNAGMRVINGGLFLLSSFLAGTGWLLAERLPHGRQGGARVSFLGLNRHDWAEWHNVAAWTAAAFLALHLLMNWQWLVVIASSRKSWRLWTGLIAGLAILAAFVALPLGTG